MQRVLIADGSEIFRKELAQELETEFAVSCAADGCRALEMLKSCSPELLVLDMTLPGIDGISLLHLTAEERIHPMVLVTTRFLSDYMADALAELKIGYVVRKPCSSRLVAQRVRDLLRRCPAAEPPAAAQPAMVPDPLTHLGIPANLRGTQYLHEAVALLRREPHQYITKELYPAVGRAFGVEWQRVERCIRNAICIAWQKRDERIWRQYFRTDAAGSVIRPTNTEFIVRLASVQIQK